MIKRSAALLAQFDDITCSGLIRTNTLVGGVQTNGQVLTQHLVAGAPQAVALATGANADVVLAQLGFQGRMLFNFTSAGDAVLDSIAPATGEICSVTCPPGTMIVLNNGNASGGHLITTTANSGGTAGNRFSLAVQIDGGAACAFVYDGTLWRPLMGIVPGG